MPYEEAGSGNRNIRPGIGMLFCLLLLMLSLPAMAARQGEVRLVLDVSGSMKSNDPSNLRANGIRLLVELLPTNMRAGLWTFGDRVANPLALGTVDEQWREHALSVLPRLTEYQQFTDIETALREATRAPGEDGTVHIILLTDGMVDIPAGSSSKPARDAASRQRILDQLAPELADRNVVVDTIALSRNADIPLLRRLSQQTGGLASVAETPEELLRSFLDVLGRVVPRQEVPLEQGHFDIDDRIDSFTALLFHDRNEPPISLSTPQSSTLSAGAPNVRWRHDDRFDLITVPSPAEGRWQINGNVGPGSRILVESSLKLAGAELPATLYQYFETPLEAWLDGGQGNARATAITAELRQQGTLIDSAILTREEDGHFRGHIEPGGISGNARLRLEARGEGFTRLRQQSVDVAPALSATLAENQSSIVLQAAYDRLDRSNTTLTATLQGESLPVETLDAQRWRANLPDTLPETSVPVELSARVRLDDATREIPLPPVWLNRDAAVGVAGAQLDRSAINAREMASSDQEATETTSGPEAWLQSLWSRIGSEWPAARQQLTEWGREPWSWGVAAALAMAWLFLLLHRRQRQRRRRRRRREPHL
ncbi:hypothetical protein BH688_09640 [Kushneria phosphatilytica]|nr:hypothetical protein BH688_09640 [Kushneria phosphatilytica]